MKLADHSNELASDLKLIAQWLNANSQLFNNNEQRHRFEHGVLPDSLLILVENSLNSSKSGLKQLNKIHQLILESYKDGNISPWQIEPLLVDIGTNLNRMENQAKLWKMLSFKTSAKSAPMVRWIELTDPAKNEYFLRAAPIEVGYFLEDKLWSQAHGAILCSATLLALDSFDSFRKSAGLKNNDGTQYIKLLSPFDFQQNAKLIIPKMVAEPSDSGFGDELVVQIKQRVTDQMATLVLFSSYRQMNQVAKDLRGQHKLSLLVQGEASRNALLALHKDKCDNELPSILFGTSSFSEGLDLPGAYLTNLIITKLPFAVPTSPVEQAHAEYIKSKNGNPFLILTVPDASRKLIQSCGRLLRNEQDQGTITILDRRLVTKRYGQSLINSLPPYKLTIE
jgi:ATP-dependent DNA helicase DinG